MRLVFSCLFIPVIQDCIFGDVPGRRRQGLTCEDLAVVLWMKEKCKKHENQESPLTMGNALRRSQKLSGERAIL